MEVLTDGAPDPLHPSPAEFRHDAFVYTDDDDFVAQAVPFVRTGLEAGQTVVAALPERNLRLLRSALGATAAQVVLLDIRQVGSNPARLIPVWRTLIDQAPGVPLRGLGEPAYRGRSAAELEEAALHELLVDVAFHGSRSVHLRCPYSAAVPLDPAEVHVSATPDRSLPGARRPVATTPRDTADRWIGHRTWPSAAEAAFRAPLSSAPPGAESREFGLGELTAIRHWVNAVARVHRLSTERTEDLELALHEICTNSIRFGGGQGRLTVWTADGSLVCDVTDKGHIDDLLVGRVSPPVDGLGGRGVWLANQLCDLVQVRSGNHGTQVRLHTRLP